MGLPSIDELKSRIQRERDHFNGSLPDRVAIAWDGYIAALLEWGLISPSEHKEISDLLPDIPDNPVIAIFLGRGPANTIGETPEGSAPS